MAKLYACPYWSWEKPLEIHCEMAKIKFPDQATRNKYICRYCASINGWQTCSIAQELNERYENERQA
jgi:hypothetical protein